MSFNSLPPIFVKKIPSYFPWVEQITSQKPLELLRHTEAALRQPTVSTLVPILPAKISENLQIASQNADVTWQHLGTIDIEEISDWELRSPRIQVGLSFVGFSALMVIILVLYLHTLHPHLTPIAQISKYWYQYVWFVCLGVAGMFILGREAMRPISRK
ncbi:hypothetical protein [Calothrix sp. 336/3]|uniref:hypothetical protein n=1 Tax=Calothrix sp. 336/3 TaxID=1337936 RepID=UPI0006244B97|nr:hypothetical protein [Calothrix sp. 336/3]AKG22976.1 hypothetical protein IJ00_18335 [Calothrix sp. 336/3]